MNTGERGNARERDDWWQNQSKAAKSGSVCAVVLAALLLVCGGLWLFIKPVTGTAAAVTVTAGAAPVSPAAAPAPALPAGTSSLTTAPATTAPTDATWRKVGLGGLPFSASAGPRSVTAGVPSGFAQTPNGSVLAAEQILGRMSWAAETTTTMRAVADKMTTPTAQAAASLTYGPPTDPTVVPRLAGYQVIAYSDTQAVINIALSFNSTLREVPATMQWIGGDWRLAGAPGPLSQTNWAQLNNLENYVVFSGELTGGA